MQITTRQEYVSYLKTLTMKTKSTVRFLLIGTLLVACGCSLHAADYYFDTNGTTEGFGNTNGAYSGTLWSTASDGTGTPALATSFPIGETDQLYFGSSTYGYTGTVSGNRKFTGAGNLRIGSASGNILFTGGWEIAGTAGNGIRSSSTATVEFSGLIIGTAGSITQSGNGTLILSNTANTWGGSGTATDNVTTISGGGTIKVNKLANGGSASSLGDSSNASTRLVFNNGSLVHYGAAASSTDRNFTIQSGGATIKNDSVNTSHTLTWAGAPTAATGGTRSFTLGGTNTGDNTFSGTISNNTTGVIALTKADAGKWILTNTANAYTGSTTISGGRLQIGGAGRLNSGSYAGDISIANGGILQYSSSAGQNLSGVITGSGNIIKDTSTSDLTLSNDSNNLSGNITVSAGRVIANSVGRLSNGATNLIQSGAGQLYLQGANTYDNAISLSGAGYSAVSGDSVLNTMSLRLDAGSLSNTITLAGSGARIGNVSGGGQTVTISGKITGSHGIDFYGAANGNNYASTFIISNTANDYTGNTTIFIAPFSNTLRTNISNTLKLGASNVISNGANAGNVVFDQFGGNTETPTARLDLAGYNETINGVVVNNGVNAVITNSAVGASLLQIGDNNTTSSFSGVITEAGSGATLAISKIGNGTLTLTGTNTYTGTTTVTAGSLIINGSIASSSVVVNSTLGGSGVMANATITGSGSVNPGNSPGILTAAATNPTGGLDYNFEFTQANVQADWDAPTASINDVLRLTAATPFTAALDTNNIISIYLNLASISLYDVFTGGFYTDNNAAFLSSINSATFQYLIASETGAITYNGETYDLYSGPYNFSVATVSQTANFGSGNVSGYVTQFTAIPEPRVALLGCIGILLLLRRRR